ncbi:hypothetical protein TSUD_86830 [Trifolium subterraneum]|uniref:Uncharacterized protein n=1 Tax=Trifolium subterraneum TaxID=3900 RepID=A0A2Z6PKT7_TRISU|nr:hypothetical protein TSUD_86830 [Trifolium subterraneum]
MFNAFQYYGDIIEVIIPAKLDKRWRRFGFARFDKVVDGHRFEYELDNIIIGRDKIDVNLAHFQRQEGIQGFEGGRDEKQREGGDLRRTTGNYDKEKDAEKEDMERLSRAFIGEVVHPGMSYNIQNAFHRQGYFGVKVTPLGSNLTLLEGQEEGEVKDLMEDAKGWLEQWFKEIRPWNPKEIDVERSVWLRHYGVPSHAWNEIFFAQVVKPWDIFINTDDGTLKKNTIDVACGMYHDSNLISTSCE